MRLRQSIHVGVVSVCLVLIAFALLMALAIHRLERENADLKLKLTKAVEDVAHELEEHRNEERDRYFEAGQSIKLEGSRTREAIKDASHDNRR